VVASACASYSHAGVLESHYSVAVDVDRAADLYAQGRTLRQIGAELGVHWSTVSQQLQRAGIAMGLGTPPSHPASTKPIIRRWSGPACVLYRRRW
jgi:hypothetical protein